MPLTIVKEDSAYRCNACRNVLNMKKGQLLPPCPRCGQTMEKVEGSLSQQDSPCCS